MSHKHFESNIGIGPTEELSLRVSVAALVRVLFEDSHRGDLMLALERRATLHKTSAGHVIEVKSQPFGGALRLHDIEALQNLVGDFHFDSEESRLEQDFRIFIQHSAWEAVRGFCISYLAQPGNPVLESDPSRELAEEFQDTMKITLTADQYALRDVCTIVEDDPSVGGYFYGGYPTARIYRIFEARLLDSFLTSATVENSESFTDQDLCELASQDFRIGRNGRANAVLTLPYEQISAAYLAVPLERRNTPIWFQNHQLDETVAAILDVDVPKYRRLER